MKFYLRSLIMVFGLLVILIFTGCGYTELSTEEEVILGEQIALEVESYYDLYRDPVQCERVERIGKDLTKFTTRPFLYRFKILDSDEINAFAIPGGYIYIYKGLLDMGLSDDQLAAVMAHEITHIEAFHIAQFYERMKKRELFYTIAVLATGGAAYEPIRILSYLDAYVFEPKYSRTNEKECDISGVHMLIHSGRDPYEFPRLFEMWEKEKLDSGWLPGWMKSHPDFIARINYIEEEISLQSALIGKTDHSSIYPVLTFEDETVMEEETEEVINLEDYLSVNRKEDIIELSWNDDRGKITEMECYGLNKKQRVVTNGKTSEKPFTLVIENGKDVKYLLTSVRYSNGDFLWDVIRI